MFKIIELSINQNIAKEFAAAIYPFINEYLQSNKSECFDYLNKKINNESIETEENNNDNKQ